MPSLSDSMEEGTDPHLAQGRRGARRARRRAGRDRDRQGDDDLRVAGGGTLEIVVEAGTTVAVGTVIARAQDVDSVAGDDAAGESGGPRTMPPASQGSSTTTPPRNPPSPTIRCRSARPRRRLPTVSTAVAAAPLARRLASAHDVDLSRVSGSGPRGRIGASTSSSQRACGRIAGASTLSTRPGPRPASRRPTSRGPGGRGGKGTSAVVQPTRLQQVIARRMAEAKATIPEFQVEAEVALMPRSSCAPSSRARPVSAPRRSTT